MIHCIGDSHSAVFSGEENMQPIWPMPAANKLPYFKSYRIGPATAYQLENKIDLISSLLNSIDLKDDDKIMFCFGEVDIRAHLVKRSLELQIPISDLVVECIDRYLNTISWFIKNYKQQILIWGPIASWCEPKIYTGGPSYGSIIERNFATKLFNTILLTRADEIGYKYISIFNEMLNDDSTTNVDFLDDWDGSHMHLSQRAMPVIIDKFKKASLI